MRLYRVLRAAGVVALLVAAVARALEALRLMLLSRMKA